MEFYELRNADFVAEITILTLEEGGRSAPPRNHIRWDFGYVGDPAPITIYMIYPNFLHENSVPVPEGIPLSGTLTANMHIQSPKAVPFHRSRLEVGLEFNCHEGKRVVARGVVTRLMPKLFAT